MSQQRGVDIDDGATEALVVAADDRIRRLRVGARAFWAYTIGFFVVIYVIFIVEADRFGHGIGIGDGIHFARGQSMVRGRLDGIGAVAHVTSYWRDAGLIAAMFVADAALVATCYLIASRLVPADTGVAVPDPAQTIGDPFESLSRWTTRLSAMLLVAFILVIGVGFPVAVVLYAVGHPLA